MTDVARRLAIRSRSSAKIKEAYGSTIPRSRNLMLEIISAGELKKDRKAAQHVETAAKNEEGNSLPASAGAPRSRQISLRRGDRGTCWPAQRDYSAAHTYERVDKPRGEFFHNKWDRSRRHDEQQARITFNVGPALRRPDSAARVHYQQIQKAWLGRAFFWTDRAVTPCAARHLNKEFINSFRIRLPMSRCVVAVNIP